MTSVIEGDMTYGDKYAYKSIHKPVYRGINHSYVDHNNYKPNSIGFWPQFTSTTTDLSTANTFSQ